MNERYIITTEDDDDYIVERRSSELRKEAKAIFIIGLVLGSMFMSTIAICLYKIFGM